MDEWKQDGPWLRYAIAALLGMIAGVAAKQAVAIQAGNLPKPITVLADILVLGMVWIIAMYTHQSFPHLSLEAVALLSAALAMWGPKGIAALLHRFQRGALRAADTLVDTYTPPIDPVHRPTNLDAIPREQEMRDLDIEGYGAKAPIRKLRDEIPLDTQSPVDMQNLLSQMDTPKDGDDETSKGGSHE